MTVRDAAYPLCDVKPHAAVAISTGVYPPVFDVALPACSGPATVHGIRSVDGANLQNEGPSMNSHWFDLGRLASKTTSARKLAAPVLESSARMCVRTVAMLSRARSA